ncbi:MAG TPA: hypothetical protein VFH45_04090, partial [Acidimicrobiales bacterium]|nr:hypothetical protein [Acidimicrobiales bacterium]
AQVQAVAAACAAFRNGVQPAIRTAGNTHDPTPIQRVQQGQPAEGGPVEANAPYITMVSNIARARFNPDYVTLYADIANLTTAITHIDRNKLDASLSTIRQDGDQIATECKNLGH